MCLAPAGGPEVYPVTRCASQRRFFFSGFRGLWAVGLVAAAASGCIDGASGRGARGGEKTESPVLIPALAPECVCPPVAADAAAGAVVVDAGAAADPGGGQAQMGQGNVNFPPLLDVRFFQLDLAAVGAPGNSGPIFNLVNAVAKNAVDDLQRFIDISRVTVDVDAQGRPVERRTAPGFESRQTFFRGIQYAVVFLNGQKKLQFTRNHNTGAFEGVIVAPSFDNNAPISTIVTPLTDGTFSHLIVEDIGNNAKNDYRGELVVDANLAPLKFTFFQQFNGGLAAQPESAALVRKFDFTGIAGF